MQSVTEGNIEAAEIDRKERRYAKEGNIKARMSL
jgi:hypothetical protein